MFDYFSKLADSGGQLMKSVTCEEMRAIEEKAFTEGWSADALMEIAGEGIAQVILRYYPERRHVTAYLGKGHNAGDALVALRHLRQAGWQVNLRHAYSAGELAPLTRSKLDLLGEMKSEQAPVGSVLLDGLVGIGGAGALRGELQELAAEMNWNRTKMDCTTVALDVPSGVNADDGEVFAGAVVADHTICIGLPKVGLLQSSAVNHVGALSLVPIAALQASEENRNGFDLLCAASLRRERRSFDTHKGQAGRVGIWAGCEGMLGATALCAAAALKAGAGLVTVFTAPTLYPILAGMLLREVMCQITIDPRKMLESSMDALVIGPGMGEPVASVAERLLFVAENVDRPCVLDADMLNLIARDERQDVFRNSQLILTPHPGEMGRILPSLARLERAECVRGFCESYPSTLLLKGARSLISQAGEAIFVNSTGTPAMATAGQGDVLSGMIAALCAQGYEKLEAAKLAAWLAGESAQLAMIHSSEEALTASDVIAGLPLALRGLRRGR